MNALENQFKQSQLISDSMNHLRSLAQAFYRTGNISVGDEIMDAIQVVLISVDSIGDEYAKEVHASIRHSNNQLGKLLTTIMDKE